MTLVDDLAISKLGVHGLAPFGGQYVQPAVNFEGCVEGVVEFEL